MNFGSRLAALRRQRKMTQAALAQRIHVSTRTIQNYEKAERNDIPSEKVLSSLAEVLEVDMTALLYDDICKTYLLPYKKMMNSIDNSVSEYNKIENQPIIMPDWKSVAALSLINPVYGLATIGGAVLPQGISKLIANKKMHTELKKQISNAERRCIMETYNCRNAIVRYQQRYNRKIEISDDSNENDDIIKTIIEIIFAYQDCMTIWFEQHLLFSECLRVLDDSKDDEARAKIDMHIKNINGEDRDKEDILKRIVKLETHLQEIGG